MTPEDRGPNYPRAEVIAEFVPDDVVALRSRPTVRDKGGSVVYARDAREWAADGGLRGIGDSLYTPFNGRDGDDIDWDAYRVLVRYCAGDLDHAMVWLTSGIAEWWSLTMDERKRLLEVAVEEARALNPDVVIQACTAANSAKETAELTLHAQQHGADIAYIQTPPMEVHAGEGVLRFFQYVADRTDIALGMFNSPSSGYVLTPEEMAEIYLRIPAVVAVKEGVQDSIMPTLALHELAPGLVIWECDTMVYEAGWLQDGIVGPAQLGTAGYLYETPDDKWYTHYWELIWGGDLQEARAYLKDHAATAGMGNFGDWLTEYPARTDYFTHWGEAFKVAAAALGLPVGDYPHSRPPQAILPAEARVQIRAAYEKAGQAGKALGSAALKGTARVSG
jgi:4-hydroxy-tetrahydrodipicolinate synthase